MVSAMGAGIGLLGFAVMMVTGDELMRNPMAHFVLDSTHVPAGDQPRVGITRRADDADDDQLRHAFRIARHLQHQVLADLPHIVLECGKTEGDADTIIFKNGRFRSIACDKYDYGDGAYTATGSVISPVRNLTQLQVEAIFSRNITRWTQLNGIGADTNGDGSVNSSDNQTIILCQRRAGSGTKAAFGRALTPTVSESFTSGPAATSTTLLLPGRMGCHVGVPRKTWQLQPLWRANSVK